jgi:hypothetical protein
MANAVATTAGKLPQQLLEVAMNLYQAETAGLELETPDITARKMNISPNMGNQTVSITVVLPATITQDTDGGINFDATDYLPNVA